MDSTKSKKRDQPADPGVGKKPGSSTGTATEVRSPTKTSTSTEAYTAGNITVTGGAGDGETKVVIHQNKPNEDPKANAHKMLGHDSEYRKVKG